MSDYSGEPLLGSGWEEPSGGPVALDTRGAGSQHSGMSLFLGGLRDILRLNVVLVQGPWAPPAMGLPCGCTH